jgi:predicted RNA-binding Zn-ribbon protein involved in translation (DUF1610 family)
MSNEFIKAQSYECPSCGANLPIPDAESFHCDYCGKLIIVPPELRTHPAKAETRTSGMETSATVQVKLEKEISTDATRDQAKQKRSVLIITLSIALFVIIIGALLSLLFLLPTSSSSTINEPQHTSLSITPLPTMVQFARLAMVFGSQGDEPGQFNDARSIAVDQQGNIFVADYTSGRINKFDPQGNFLQLIQLKPTNDNPDVYIFGIAADAIGNLYVASNGDIIKYSADEGNQLLTIPDQWPDIYFQAVIVAPDGNLYSTNGMAGADDIIILDPQGEVLDHWVDTIENVNHDDPSIDLALGVNHSGMVYILSPFGNKVYSYNPDGTYNFSFGVEGDRPGQFKLSTGLLAITSQDYLVISDVYRVDLFDQQGNYLNKTFTIDYQTAGGSMYGMAIDAHDDLYFISSGGKVLKFEMDYP